VPKSVLEAQSKSFKIGINEDDYHIYIIAKNIIKNAQNIEIVKLQSEDNSEAVDIILHDDPKYVDTSGTRLVNIMKNFSRENDNEYAWLSFNGAILQAETIAEILVDLDSRNKAIYMDNVGIFVEKTRSRQAVIQLKAANFSKKNIAAANEFKYIVEDLGLNNVVSSMQMSDEYGEDEYIEALNGVQVMFIADDNNAENIKQKINDLLPENSLNIVALSTITKGSDDSEEFFRQIDENFVKIAAALQ
jgi:ABC-type Zn uptake system ZnuABC Zn-binding protein ZnuA